MSRKRYLTFFGLSLTLAIAPGPDILFVLAQSLAHGWRAGSLVTWGLCSGLCFHVTLAALGVAALLKSRPWFFKTITWFGAAYLVWLGIGAWNEARVVAIGATGAEEALPPIRLYLRGVVMNVLNPKVMLFFLALVPRFVVPDRGSAVRQFMVLGAIFALAVALLFHLVALCGGLVAQALTATPGAMDALRYFSALVMFGIAIWIAMLNLREVRQAKRM